VRRPEYCKSGVLEYRDGTVGNDCFIFDDQYEHRVFRFLANPLRIQATNAAAGSGRGGVRKFTDA
jgi:hypothetical protein